MSEKEVKEIVLLFQEFMRKRKYFEPDPWRKPNGISFTYEDFYDLFIIDYKKRKDEKDKR